MTKEMAEQMNGPTGALAREIAAAMLAEFDIWAGHEQDTAGVRADLMDYLPHTLCTLLTEMQLTGAIAVEGNP